jgi:hypothetical protein
MKPSATAKSYRKKDGKLVEFKVPDNVKLPGEAEVEPACALETLFQAIDEAGDDGFQVTAEKAADPSSKLFSIKRITIGTAPGPSTGGPSTSGSGMWGSNFQTLEDGVPAGPARPVALYVSNTTAPTKPVCVALGSLLHVVRFAEQFTCAQVLTMY